MEYIWPIVFILILLWLAGLFFRVAGGFIYILLAAALVLMIIRLAR